MLEKKITKSIIQELVIAIVIIVFEIVLSYAINDPRWQSVSLTIIVFVRYMSSDSFPMIANSSLGLVLLTIYKSIALIYTIIASNDIIPFLGGMSVVGGLMIYYFDPNINFIKLMIDIDNINKIKTKKNKEKINVEKLL